MSDAHATVKSRASRASRRVVCLHARDVARAVTSAGSAAWIDLARFAAGIARHDVADAARAIARLRRAGGPRRAVEETALMVIPNVGYPAGLEALRVLQEGMAGARARDPRGGRARGGAAGESRRAALADRCCRGC